MTSILDANDARMNTGETLDTPAAGRGELIRRRLQIGSLVLAAVLVVNGLLDAGWRPGGLLPVAWIYVANLALVLAVQLFTRTRHEPRATVPVATLAIVCWNALFCIYALRSPSELPALVAPPIVMTTAAALLLPWGLLPQAFVSTVCVATYVVAFLASGRAADLGTLYAIVALLGAAAVSCVGAHVVEQHRRLIDRQTARLRQLNRLLREASVKKDEFLASVSHELRTPLNVVLGYIDLLLDHSFGPLEPAQRDILHRITKNASNLSRLINDLIDLSRIEAGRLRVDIGVVDLDVLFADFSGVMDVLLAGHDVAFHVEIAAGCGKVHSDPDRLKQIISNLLVNAVKFTDHGSITLRAGAIDDEHVAISVIDTGIGIPRAAHDVIFEPFRQAHDRKHNDAGAGIGLSISSRLAQLMGGNLTVESEPGRGSRFTLTVPAAKGAGGGQPRAAELLRNVS